MTRLRLPVLLAALAVAVPARGQTMLDQEERLIDIHSLLLDLPSMQAPVAFLPGQLSVALELVGIPYIDGTTGSKTQITASDRTRVYPRPRLAVGLPAPGGFRAFAGLSYIPPVEIRDVSTNAFAAEAGFAWVPGAFRIGVRAHGTWATSKAPVTDPATRDVLDTQVWGADLSAGGSFAAGSSLLVEPYAGGGLVSLHGRFEVTSDGNVLTSDHTGPAWHVGARALFRARWELVAEVSGYPDRLVHTDFRLGFLFGG